MAPKTAGESFKKTGSLRSLIKSRRQPNKVGSLVYENYKPVQREDGIVVYVPPELGYTTPYYKPSVVSTQIKEIDAEQNLILLNPKVEKQKVENKEPPHGDPDTKSLYSYKSFDEVNVLETQQSIHVVKNAGNLDKDFSSHGSCSSKDMYNTPSVDRDVFVQSEKLFNSSSTKTIEEIKSKSELDLFDNVRKRQKMLRAHTMTDISAKSIDKDFDLQQKVLHRETFPQTLPMKTKKRQTLDWIKEHVMNDDKIGTRKPGGVFLIGQMLLSNMSPAIPLPQEQETNEPVDITKLEQEVQDQNEPGSAPELVEYSELTVGLPLDENVEYIEPLVTQKSKRQSMKQGILNLLGIVKTPMSNAHLKPSHEIDRIEGQSDGNNGEIDNIEYENGTNIRETESIVSDKSDTILPERKSWKMLEDGCELEEYTNDDDEVFNNELEPLEVNEKRASRFVSLTSLKSIFLDKKEEKERKSKKEDPENINEPNEMCEVSSSVPSGEVTQPELSDTESADHGSTDKSSVAKLTQPSKSSKSKLSLVHLFKSKKENALSTAPAPVESEQESERVQLGNVKGEGVVYAELDLGRGHNTVLRNDDDKTEYAEIVLSKPSESDAAKELRKSIENLASPTENLIGDDSTTTVEGKKEAAV